MKTTAYLILLYITSTLSLGNAAEYGAVINANLSSLNSSDNVFKMYAVLNGYAEIVAETPFVDFGYLLVQVHSFKDPVLLSSTSELSPDTYVNGTNIGLIDSIENHKHVYYLYSSPGVNTTVLLAIIGHDSKDPIPGGCNLTFDMEIAPYQKVTNLNHLIRIDAQPPGLEPDGQMCPEIDIELYHMYLEEWDLSEKGYFGGIEKMLSLDKILQNGRRVHRSTTYPTLRKYYVAYPGTGSVYSIVTNFHGFRSEYVSIVSYGCDLSNKIETCYESVSVYWKILYGLMVLIGLLICFEGQPFFQMCLFCIGFFAAAALTYGLLDSLDLSDGAMIIILSAGSIIYSVLWTALWWKCGIPYLSVIGSFITAGYLLAALFFYVGLADVPVLENDINYWSVLIGITTLTMFAFLTLSKLQSNILSTSFIGAYIAMVPFDYYIGGNIRYIFLNTVHRATVPHFNIAVNDPPSDYSLLIGWALITMLGVYTQWKQMRGRGGSGGRYRMTETTPLLG